MKLTKERVLQIGHECAGSELEELCRFWLAHQAAESKLAEAQAEVAKLRDSADELLRLRYAMAQLIQPDDITTIESLAAAQILLENHRNDTDTGAPT